MKLTKRQYLHGFTLVVVVLALVRCVTGIGAHDESERAANTEDSSAVSQAKESISSPIPYSSSGIPQADGFTKHRIMSVPSYKECFPDTNDLQMTAAQQFGVPPVQNRQDAEKRKTELVYVGANPYFEIDELRQSIPYLVPRASVLLQDIGKAFHDSLYVKGVHPHQLIITSVLRTEDDVETLRKRNRNASENSCHRYGTTFDISYRRYKPVQTTIEPHREVSNDTLKFVLAEVLRDMRESGRCYIKYEVKQSCFHITTR